MSVEGEDSTERRKSQTRWDYQAGCTFSSPVLFVLTLISAHHPSDQHNKAIGDQRICMFLPAGGGSRASSRARFWKHTFLTGLGGGVSVHVNSRHMHMLRHVTGLWGVLTFMLTCATCTCYVTSLGWGGVNVHVNSRHMHMLRHVTGLGGVNVHVNLRHMHVLRHVTGFGGVNVHVNLRHMHMLRHVTGLWGVLAFMLTCATCTCYVTSLGGGC